MVISNKTTHCFSQTKTPPRKVVAFACRLKFGFSVKNSKREREPLSTFESREVLQRVTEKEEDTHRDSSERKKKERENEP